MTLRIGWFTTGRGPGSRGLFEFTQKQITQGYLGAEIEFVFSNRERGESTVTDNFFDVVKSYDIPLITLSSAQMYRTMTGAPAQKRLNYDRMVMDRLSQFRPHICMLAGYMLIVGEHLSDHYTMLNLHPSIPGGPSGTWQQVIWETIRTRPDNAGAMIHIATKDLDKGPPISYYSFPTQLSSLKESWDEIQDIPIERLRSTYGQDLAIFQRLRYEEYRREPFLISETIRAIEMGEISLQHLETLKKSTHNSQPICLNTIIELSINLAPE